MFENINPVAALAIGCMIVLILLFMVILSKWLNFSDAPLQVLQETPIATKQTEPIAYPKQVTLIHAQNQPFRGLENPLPWQIPNPAPIAKVAEYSVPSEITATGIANRCYLARYPDVNKWVFTNNVLPNGIIDGFLHYQKIGAAEGRRWGC